MENYNESGKAATTKWIIDDLARSGIPETETARLGCELVRSGEFERLIGFEPREQVEGYTIRFNDPSNGKQLLTPDRRPFVRVKLERPVDMLDGRKAKYLSPRNGGQQPFITPEAHASYAQNHVLLLTEGEKKAVKATLVGNPAVGLVGGWGWWDSEGRTILPALDPYTQPGSTWFVVLDSDAAWNRNFVDAMSALRVCLEARGCLLRVSIIPHGLAKGPNIGIPQPLIPKLGLDDLIIRDGPEAAGQIMESAAELGQTANHTGLLWFATALVQGVPDDYLGALSEEFTRKTLFDKISHAHRRELLSMIRQKRPELLDAIDQAMRSRLDSENHPAVQDGGQGVINGVYVAAPGHNDTLIVEGISGDIAFVSNGHGAVSRPYYRRHLIHINRAGQSVANGRLGGRPMRISAAEAATLFMGRHRDAVTGLSLFRHYRGVWYQYAGGHYKKLQMSDMEATVTTFLRSHPELRTASTSRFVIDLLLNLRATNACGISSDIRTPCRLMADGAVDAPGWVTLGNLNVNIRKLAESLNDTQIPESDVFCDHSPELFGTFALDFDFDSDADCPLFKATIEELLPTDDVRRQVQMLFGLVLISETKYNVFFILFGPAGCGKSTLLYVLRAVAGIANCCSLSFAHFSEKHSVGDLTEHLVNCIGDGQTETPDGYSLGHIEGLIKQVCDGEPIRVERKYQEPYEAPAIARNIFAVNHLPNFVDRTNGIWDRLRIIPFERIMRGQAGEDLDRRDRIVATEMPGVFLWAVQGLAMLLREPRFPESARGLELKQEHRGSVDHERAFLSETVEGGTEDDFIHRDDLFQRYRGYCTAAGLRYPLTAPRFNARVQSLYPSAMSARIRLPDKTQPHVWKGLRYQETEP